MYIILFLVRFFLLLCVSYFIGCKVGLVGTCAHTSLRILDNTILYEKKISILIVIADPGSYNILQPSRHISLQFFKVLTLRLMNLSHRASR